MPESLHEELRRARQRRDNREFIACILVALLVMQGVQWIGHRWAGLALDVAQGVGIAIGGIVAFALRRRIARWSLLLVPGRRARPGTPGGARAGVVRDAGGGRA